MNITRRSKFKEAMYLLEKGASDDALKIATSMINSGDDDQIWSGHFCAGLILESDDKATGLPLDLEKAIWHFHRLAYAVPSALAFLSLARASMRKADYVAALKYLKIAQDYGEVPEIWLGYAQYHRAAPNGDLKVAQKNYLKAALAGNFQGFFGYAEVSRMLGQPFRAIAMDSARLILGPLIFLALRDAAHTRF
jgi:hypothetical protein